MSSPKARKAKQARAQRARRTARDARIVEDLPIEEIRKLPKLSATILEFAMPITSTMPTPPRRKDMEAAMKLAQIAWNLPLVRQHEANSELAAQWDALAPRLAPAIHAILDSMMTTRRTAFGHDPRFATVEVRVNEEGEVSVYAEARLVSRQSPF